MLKGSDSNPPMNSIFSFDGYRENAVVELSGESSRKLFDLFPL